MKSYEAKLWEAKLVKSGVNSQINPTFIAFLLKKNIAAFNPPIMWKLDEKAWSVEK